MFLALFVVALGFAAVLGVLASSQRLWRHRWRVLPVASGLHAVGTVFAISATGGSVGTAIVVAIVMAIAELASVAAMGSLIGQRLTEPTVAGQPLDGAVLKMSIDSIIGRVRALQFQGTLEHGSPVPEREIERCERDLGVVIPHPFKHLIMEFGWIESPTMVLYGVRPDGGNHLNVVSETLWERHHARVALGPEYLPFSSDGAGNVFCLTVTPAAEPEVVLAPAHRKSPQDVEVVATSFVDFLRQKLDDLEAYVAEQ